MKLVNENMFLLSGLNGAMSNISMGFNNSGNSSSSSANGNNATAAATAVSKDGQQPDDDFHCFVLEEITRRCGNGRKRPSSTPGDTRVESSPTRKRSRLL